MKAGLWIPCLVAGFTGSAQEVMNKDSLLRLLPQAREDSAGVALYIQIGQQYEMNNYDSAGWYYQRANEISKKAGYIGGQIKFIANYSYILNIKGKLDSSLLLNKQAIALAAKINDRVALGKAYANTGNVYYNLGNIDSALYHYRQAQRLFEQTGNAQLEASLADIMQNAYNGLKQYDKAIELGEKSLLYYRQADDRVSKGRVLANLATSYELANQPAKAMALLREALEISRSIGYQELEQTVLLNIANQHLQALTIDSLKPYFEKVLELGKTVGSSSNNSIAYRGLGYYYYYKRRFGTAEQMMQRALQLDSASGQQLDMSKSLEGLSNIYIATGQLEEGQRIIHRSTELQNMLIGDEVRKQVLLAEKKYETEKKEALIRLQESTIRQKNTLNYLLIGAAVALLVIFLLSYRNYQQQRHLQQQRINELETEKQLTATEAVLKGEEQERTRLAKDLHDGLGGMLSGIKYALNNMKGNLVMTPENAQAFERSIDMLDSSIREMRRVAHNMMPEALVKFGLDTALKDFCNDINQSGALQVRYQSIGLTPDALGQTAAISVYRIVQELVNNSIKHAQASELVVQVAKTSGDISITVEDNGRGFDASSVRHEAKGMGWGNIRNRVEFLKGKLDVQSAPGEGTSVLIEFSL